MKLKTVALCLLIAAIVACRAPRRSPTNVTATNVPSKVTTAIHGRVANVNTSGQFVVLRFPPGFMPRRHQVLKIYRDGTNIGSVKITALRQDITTVADILSGEPQIGDEVRGD